MTAIKVTSPAPRVANPLPGPLAPNAQQMLRLFAYLRPHLFGVAFAVPLSYAVKAAATMGGSCNALCRPGVALTLGLLGGLLGAQLYRSENPLP